MNDFKTFSLRLAFQIFQQKTWFLQTIKSSWNVLNFKNFTGPLSSIFFTISTKKNRIDFEAVMELSLKPNKLGVLVEECKSLFHWPF